MSAEQSLNIILSCSNCGKDTLTAILREYEDVVALFLVCADEECREEQRQKIMAENPEETDEDFLPVLQTFILHREQVETLLTKVNEQELN